MALLRLVAYVGAIYLFYLLAFPEWDGMVYHVASTAILMGAAVGVFFFLKAFNFGSRLVRVAVELAFIAGVLLYLGYTMPQKSGKTPFELWAEGHRPTRSDARDGLARLGVDANSKPAELLIGLFPKH